MSWATFPHWLALIAGSWGSGMEMDGEFPSVPLNPILRGGALGPVPFPWPLGQNSWNGRYTLSLAVVHYVSGCYQVAVSMVGSSAGEPRHRLILLDRCYELFLFVLLLQTTFFFQLDDPPSMTAICVSKVRPG